MDKFHKVIAFFTIMRMFDMTIAGHARDKTLQSRDLTTYQLNVPGKQPITILEDDDLHPGLDKVALSPYSDYSSVGQVQFTKRVSNGPTFHSDMMKPIPFSIMPEDDERKNGPKKHSYNPTLLEKFLEKYQGPSGNEGDTEAVDMEGAINLEQLDNFQRKNQRPQKNSGWVSLDPVPTYSAGKVYKWQSNKQNYRPSRPYYSQNHWNDDEDDDRYYQNRPPSRPSYNHHEDNFPESFDDDEGYHVPPKPFGSTYPGNNNYRPHDRPYSSRPTGFSGNKPYYGDHDEPDRYHSHKKRPYNDIITDNREPNFPQYDTHRYGSSSGSYTNKGKPDSYPGHGEGQWVLVSTTKGNQHNKRQSGGRSGLQRKGKSKNTGGGDIPNGSSISTVLHVLPNPNSRNITTSNGEVIEVAETGTKFGPM